MGKHRDSDKRKRSRSRSRSRSHKKESRTKDKKRSHHRPSRSDSREPIAKSPARGSSTTDGLQGIKGQNFLRLDNPNVRDANGTSRRDYSESKSRSRSRSKDKKPEKKPRERPKFKFCVNTFALGGILNHQKTLNERMDEKELRVATDKLRERDQWSRPAKLMTDVLNTVDSEYIESYEMQKLGGVYVKVPLAFECEHKFCGIKFRTAEELMDHQVVHENQPQVQAENRAKMLANQFEQNIFRND
jgi:hypothetical protein